MVLEEAELGLKENTYSVVTVIVEGNYNLIRIRGDKKKFKEFDASLI